VQKRGGIFVWLTKSDYLRPAEEPFEVPAATKQETKNQQIVKSLNHFIEQWLT
jgi:hypothetical protein